MSGRRLDVTATQAVSSLLAALTGAIAASGLGIAGTIVGAAFMSLAGTVGAAVYQHYLARSNQRLRAAASNLAPKASGNAVAAAVLRHHLPVDPDATARLRPDGTAGSRPGVEEPDGADGRTASSRAGAAGSQNTTRTAPRPASGPRGAGAGREGAARTAPACGTRPGAGTARGPGSPDAEETQVRPAFGGRSAAARLGPGGRAAGAGEADAAARGNSAAATVAADIAAAVVGGHLNGPPGAGAGGPGVARSRRRWLVLAGAVLGAFIVAMGAVTAVEAIAGRPLETLIWSRPGSGTTIGSVVGHPAATPAGTGRSSTPPPRRPPSVSVSPGSTSPSPVAPTPNPTPTGSVSPTSPASSAPGSGTSAGTGTTAPAVPSTSGGQ
jgi:hypothetical protein